MGVWDRSMGIGAWGWEHEDMMGQISQISIVQSVGQNIFYLGVFFDLFVMLLFVSFSLYAIVSCFCFYL